MDYKDVPNQDFMGYEQKLLLSAYKKYHDWWHPIDIKNESFLSVMSMHTFFETLLIYEETWFDRWINEDDIIIDKNGDLRGGKTSMRREILKYIKHDILGNFQLNSDEPFKWRKEEDDNKNEIK